MTVKPREDDRNLRAMWFDSQHPVESLGLAECLAAAAEYIKKNDVVPVEMVYDINYDSCEGQDIAVGLILLAETNKGKGQDD